MSNFTTPSLGYDHHVSQSFFIQQSTTWLGTPPNITYIPIKLSPQQQPTLQNPLSQETMKINAIQHQICSLQMQLADFYQKSQKEIKNWQKFAECYKENTIILEKINHQLLKENIILKNQVNSLKNKTNSDQPFQEPPYKKRKLNPNSDKYLPQKI